MDIISYQIGKNSAPQPSGSLSITENGTYDVTEKASAVVNVQGGASGLPLEIASNCPSPFLLNQNNITSNVKYIFPTTTASVVPVGGVTVNYIQSGGTQYIDTGVVPANHEVVAKFQYTEATNDSCIFGVTSTTYHLTWYNSMWFYACGSGESNFNGTQCTDFQVVDFNNSNNKIVMNGTEYASTNGTVSVSGNLTIFGRGGASQLCKAKLYYLKIYDRSTNTLVRDFVPAISQETGHTNEVCLYDNVTEAYLYNQGTGTFTYGEDVIPITEVDVGDEVETVLSPANSYATFSYQWQKWGSITEPPSNMVMAGTGLIVTANNTSYYKVNNGEAIVCLCNAGGWTGCLLVSKTSSAVTYREGSSTFTYSTTIVYKGETWYVSATEHWFPGTYPETSGLGRYVLVSDTNDTSTLGLLLLEAAYNGFVDIIGATSSTYTAQTGDNAIRCILTGTGNSEGTITSSRIEVQEVD